MKKHESYAIAASILGIALILLAAFVLADDNMRTISGICYGFGSASAALGIGTLLQKKMLSEAKQKAIKEQKDCEVHDERNIRIREKAGAKVNQIMFYILVAAILACTIIGTDILYILLLIGIMVTELILWIAFSNHYSKTM